MNDSSPPAAVVRHDPYLALRSRNYRRFVSGWLISTIAGQMLSIAVAWELYERTHSAFALGLVGLVQALPVILLALPAGHAVDVFDRRLVVLATQFVFCGCAAGLAAVSRGHAPLWAIYALLAVLGTARALNSPARGALLPLLVPAEAFHNAITWNSSAFHFAAVAGPSLGGLMLKWTGAAWPVYAVASAGMLVLAVALLGIRPRAATRYEGETTWRAMAAGLRFVRQEQTILAAITLDLLAVLLGSATSLMPIYAKDILHVGPVGLGLLRAAPFVGAFLMALVLAHRPPFKRAGRTMLLAVAGYGVATIAFGLSRSFELSLACLVFAGAFDNISVVVRHVLVQARTPDALRGRVAAVNTVFIESSNELGGFESGLVARWFGATVSVVSGGIGTILVVLGIAGAWPQMRRLGSLQPQAGPAETGARASADSNAA